MTQEVDKGRDRPATKSTDEKITQEMIEAGEDVLLGELGGAVSVHWDAAELAIAVYRAMSACSHSGRAQSPSRNSATR
jgi:hypothetical protein